MEKINLYQQAFAKAFPASSGVTVVVSQAEQVGFYAVSFLKDNVEYEKLYYSEKMLNNMRGTIMSTIKSDCCRAKVKVVGRTTLHYECCKCGNPCGYIAITRKSWAINPKERVVPNKKKKSRAQLNRENYE